MLTILGGEWSGRRLRAIEREGLRPSSGRVKAALFSIIESIEWKRRGEPPTFSDWKCLDLYAGVGGLGLEILSRGAATCVFVEKDRKTFQVLRENIKTLAAEARAKPLNEDVAKGAWKEMGPFDLVLLDPPYADSFLPELLAALCDKNILNPGAVVVFEHDPKVKYSSLPGLSLHSARTLGPAGISVFLRDA
ncbi:MAG: 16S rRNA (guanine(966)-N(2))-methyltransferase RsmD [Bdellovibrionota bacterium]